VRLAETGNLIGDDFVEAHDLLQFTGQRQRSRADLDQGSARPTETSAVVDGPAHFGTKIDCFSS
jgi:hypothetical protein